MNITQDRQIEATIAELYKDAKSDHFKMIKGLAKSIFRPMQAADFKEVYLSISKEQGEDLKYLIKSK